MRGYMRGHNMPVKKALQALKKVPCADCGKEYPSYVMDFDHVHGRKKNNLSVLAKYASMQAALDEAAKCDVVCANCHRERTHQRSIGR